MPQAYRQETACKKESFSVRFSLIADVGLRVCPLCAKSGRFNIEPLSNSASNPWPYKKRLMRGVRCL